MGIDGFSPSKTMLTKIHTLLIFHKDPRFTSHITHLHVVGCLSETNGLAKNRKPLTYLQSRILKKVNSIGRLVRAGDHQIKVAIAIVVHGHGPGPQTDAQIDLETLLMILELL
jgi:hypothetical protein